ncbi:sulfite oxidase heme-binding subunit YedZ [Arvimicrobium flavum]|uniref:sulfite oxidase heme-binding subunit YedZ n=1 Tax=Arvimicrobium flavum TaxID=3393320 RepID=UPI00237B03A7|nr:protein-methionine-sulfoxide reductase heme-binding subunit MsrQ [Mesorhizobium shangrilense]
MMPWTDRAGKFSPLKCAVLVGTLLPALYLCWGLANGSIAAAAPVGPLGARPITELIHRTGDWAIRFLLLSLCVSPLRRIVQWPKLINVRRMLGLAAFSYALAHLSLYALDQKFRLGIIVSEIAVRFYLTIGFVALLGLSTLAVTSTDAMIKRLGGNWNRLHRIVYVIALLASLHFFIQTKLDVYQATLMAGFLLALFGYRIAHARGFSLTSPWVLLSIAVLAALATAVVEVAWYGLATNVPPLRVLAANLQFGFSVRPAWWVLAAGLGVTVLGVVRPYFGPGETKNRRARPAEVSRTA